MVARYFLFVIDFDTNPENVTQYLRNWPEIENWWHHVAGTYIISTKLDMEAIASTIHKLIGKSSFILTPIEIGTLAGFLSKDAWDWIRRRVAEEEANAAETTSPELVTTP
jgi:hypothetical protein